MPSLSITLNAKGLQLCRYWQPGQGAEIQLPTDRAYAEMALDLLQRAVDCRLRSAYPVGTNLSGGMDSSAVTVLAARRLRQRGEALATFSWSPPVGADGYLPDDERPFIEAVCAQEGLTTHYARTRMEDEVEYYKRGLQIFARFPIGPTMENARAAHAQGVRVMLSGWGGDETISFGSKGYLLELLLTGQWRTLWHELPLCAKRKGVHPTRLAYGLVRSLLLPEALRWRRLRHKRKQAFSPQYFDPDFVAHMASVTALEMAPIPEWGQRRFQEALLAGGHLTDRFVAWTAITAEYNLEWRHPLLDRRLIDFSLSLPARLYHTNGWPRYLFNLAMEGILPDAMVWRNSKAEPARIEQSLRVDQQALGAFVKELTALFERPPYLIVNRGELGELKEEPQLGIAEPLFRRIQCCNVIQSERILTRSYGGTPYPRLNPQRAPPSLIASEKTMRRAQANSQS